ncbi:hypothetical protein TYRP_011430 [Tyrophagus putrescentiae]|nr:hypothetical protein TYRP_011430 [Tyrophagus putrescentiae]
MTPPGRSRKKKSLSLERMGAPMPRSATLAMRASASWKDIVWLIPRKPSRSVITLDQSFVEGLRFSSKTLCLTFETCEKISDRAGMAGWLAKLLTALASTEIKQSN